MNNVSSHVIYQKANQSKWKEALNFHLPMMLICLWTNVKHWSMWIIYGHIIWGMIKYRLGMEFLFGLAMFVHNALFLKFPF